MNQPPNTKWLSDIVDKLQYRTGKYATQTDVMWQSIRQSVEAILMYALLIAVIVVAWRNELQWMSWCLGIIGILAGVLPQEAKS
jgi:hypothetical protein